jgi:hypothetical protein
MSSEMNSFYNMTTITALHDDEAEEMNSTSIFNETNNENYSSPSSNMIDNGVNDDDEMSVAMYSVLCIKGFIFGSIILGALLGNALVILAVRRNRKLRYIKKFIPIIFTTKYSNFYPRSRKLIKTFALRHFLYFSHFSAFHFPKK